MRFLLFKHDIAELGGRIIESADILHQDCITDLRERPGYIGTMCIEQALRLVLILDPGCHLGSASPLGLARCGAATAAIAMLRLPLFIALDPAEAIDGIVSQTAEHARTINLRRQVLHARRWMGLTAVNGGFLSAVSFVERIRDQMLVIEWCQRRKNPGGIAP